MKIRIGRNDNLPEGEYELTNREKLENALGNLSYGRSDREKLLEYDRIAGRVVRDGVVLPSQSLWKLEQEHMNKPIEQFTDEELLAVIRRAENTNVPGTLYQRANNEWNIRHQQKTLEATKSGPHSGVFIAARNIKNSGSITGSRVDVITENYSGDGVVSSHEVNERPRPGFLERATNNQTIAYIIGTLVVLGILYAIYHYSGVNLSQFR